MASAYTASSDPPLLSLVLLFLSLCSAAGGRSEQLQQQSDVMRKQIKAMEYSHSYSSFSISSLDTLVQLKDAGITKGALQLTPDSGNEPTLFLVNKSGSFLLRQPFTLWQPDSADRQQRLVASFNTTFSINVYRKPNQTAGEGLTFLIAPSLDEPPPGSEGAFLGLTNATLDAKLGQLPPSSSSSSSFVAVEFDTLKQEFDPDDNHVGLDIGSVVSNKTASLTSFNITISPEEPANHTVWIDYDGLARHIWVRMAGKGAAKPSSTVLDAPLDLSEHLPERAPSYLGFSASTGSNFELNCILEWNLTVELLPAADQQENADRRWMAPVIAVAAALVVGGIAIAGLVAFRRRRRRRRPQRAVEQTLSKLPGLVREFKYEKLKKATNNFDERLRLGKGGYGIVYKGMLPLPSENGEDVQAVAVKKFIRDEATGFDDFIAEVDIINRLRHKNIVPLLGWCYRSGELLLVYEYMPNGSLEQHLFRRGVQLPVLSWEKRYRIVADVASALHYVHHEYQLERMVLHRDIKASNVMLDAAFRARLGDFGLARLIHLDKKNSFTDLAVAGTRGYIAPEYSVGHKATRHTDVFAFGALVLEIVTGKNALLGDPTCPLLVDWVWSLHAREALLEALDPDLLIVLPQNNGGGGGECTFLERDSCREEAARLLLLGLACSHPNPARRPTMAQLLQIISKSAPPPDVPPFKPAFVWPPQEPNSNYLGLLKDELAVTTTYSGTSAGSHSDDDNSSAAQTTRNATDGTSSST